MKLYHGSNTEVEAPRIIAVARALDFGAGFYTTSDYEQAVRWAKLQARRRNASVPVVSVYEFDAENARKNLKIGRFESAGRDWLKFIAQNRRCLYDGIRYDVVIGPVADDNTMPVISDFLAGAISEETALTLLLPQKLKDQYAFLSKASLSTLKFLGGEAQ